MFRMCPAQFDPMVGHRWLILIRWNSMFSEPCPNRFSKACAYTAVPPGVPEPAFTAMASSPLVMDVSSTNTLMQKSGSSPSVLPLVRGEKMVVLRITTPLQDSPPLASQRGSTQGQCGRTVAAKRMHIPVSWIPNGEVFDPEVPTTNQKESPYGSLRLEGRHLHRKGSMFRGALLPGGAMPGCVAAWYRPASPKPDCHQ